MVVFVPSNPASSQGYGRRDDEISQRRIHQIPTLHQTGQSERVQQTNAEM